MNNLFKPASFLFYLLALIVFTFLGLFFARITGAGANQGLAGGAIVLFYGVVSGGLAFIFALVFAYVGELKTIIKLNKILGVLFFVCVINLFFLVKAQEAKRAKRDMEPVLPPKTEAVD